LHALLYRNFPAVGAVFHGHHEVITNAAEELGLPVSPSLPYGSKELAEAAQLLARQGDFFVLRDHGFVATGPDMAWCGALCLRWLEQIAGPRPLAIHGR